MTFVRHFPASEPADTVVCGGFQYTLDPPQNSARPRGVLTVVTELWGCDSIVAADPPNAHEASNYEIRSLVSPLLQQRK